MNRLYVVGLGPGGPEDRTARAEAALADSEIIAGFGTYIDLVRGQYPDKEFLITGMRRESERCRLALTQAANGRTTAMVCSGDAGVYGMAGLLYELAPEFPPVEIEVVAGVTAACSGAAMLGAPLAHDFAVISLSDLLTPWALIEKRLIAAAEADFCISIYNPASIKRKDYLQRACDILLHYRSPENAAGLVRNIGRENPEARVMTLAQLRDAEADMFTTAFVGNSQTKISGGKLITPRGYRDA